VSEPVELVEEVRRVTDRLRRATEMQSANAG
jgi:hypothetical protein